MQFGKRKYFKHRKAMVETDQIGTGTRIWANAHVMKDVVIGAGCNIGENCFLESGVRVGNNVVIKNNVALWDGVVIEDEAFLGPGVVLTNDLAPRSGYPKDLATIRIRKGASIGANATIVANRTIGEYALVGAGSVVTRDVEPHHLVYGNPAKFHGWVCRCGRKLQFAKNRASCVCGNCYEMKGKSFKEIL